MPSMTSASYLEAVASSATPQSSPENSPSLQAQARVPWAGCLPPTPATLRRCRSLRSFL